MLQNLQHFIMCEYCNCGYKDEKNCRRKLWFERILGIFLRTFCQIFGTYGFAGSVVFLCVCVVYVSEECVLIAFNIFMLAQSIF